MGVRVDGVRRDGDRYVVTAGETSFEAANVVVASGAHVAPRIPVFAPTSTCRSSSSTPAYRNPSAAAGRGRVLVVGVGNSGADIALEIAATHPTTQSGSLSGHIPPKIDGWVARNIAFRVVRFLGVHVFTFRNPIGRRVIARQMAKGDPLVRVKPKWLTAAGVESVPRTVGVRDGKPVVEGGRVLHDVANIVWCVGFRQDLSWSTCRSSARTGRRCTSAGS